MATNTTSLIGDDASTDARRGARVTCGDTSPRLNIAGSDGGPSDFIIRCARQGKLAFGLIVLAGGLTALLLPLSLTRLIDGDEGYLLLAARLMSEGKIPYRDFFLTQGPVLPAVFGAWFWAAGRSWAAARIVEGVIAVIMGLFVFRETFAATRRCLAAVFATLLFAFSANTEGWLTIVKGFGLSALFALGSVLLLGAAVVPSRSIRDNRRTELATTGAGVCIGLAASTRLYVILVLPALRLYLLRWVGLGRSGRRRLGGYTLGCLCGLLPLFVSFAIERKAFVFDTLLFHGVREWGQSSLLGKASDKLPVIQKAVGLHRRATAEGRQFLVLAVPAVLAMVARLRARGRYRSAAGWVWPPLLVGSVLPNPFLQQYLCLLVPFLAVEAGVFLALLVDCGVHWKATMGTTGKHLCDAAVAVSTLACLAYYLGVGWRERDRYVHTGVDVPGIWSQDRTVRWRIETVEGAAREIDSQNQLVAASWWPGYFVSTRTRPVLALANDFGFRAAEVLSPEERRGLHVASHADVGNMIRLRTPRLFVEGNWAARPWAEWLADNGFRVQAMVHNVAIWALR